MHSFKSPKGKIEKGFTFRRFARKQILKVPLGNDERFYTAVFTLNEPVGFLKNDGRTALGALVLDGNGKTQWSTVSHSVSGINIFLRIDCRTWNPEGFPLRIWGRTWVS